MSYFNNKNKNILKIKYISNKFYCTLQLMRNISNQKILDSQRYLNLLHKKIFETYT